MEPAVNPRATDGLDQGAWSLAVEVAMDMGREVNRRDRWYYWGNQI